MASKHAIACINKSDRQSAHERIRSIGGVNPDGTHWKLSLLDAIAAIERDQFAFYVNRGGQHVEVIVALSQFGHKYLKTKADGEQPDNLLSLPECP